VLVANPMPLLHEVLRPAQQADAEGAGLAGLLRVPGELPDEVGPAQLTALHVPEAQLAAAVADEDHPGGGALGERAARGDAAATGDAVLAELGDVRSDGRDVDDLVSKRSLVSLAPQLLSATATRAGEAVDGARHLPGRQQVPPVALVPGLATGPSSAGLAPATAATCARGRLTAAALTEPVLELGDARGEHTNLLERDAQHPLQLGDSGVARVDRGHPSAEITSRDRCRSPVNAYLLRVGFLEVRIPNDGRCEVRDGVRYPDFWRGIWRDDAVMWAVRSAFLGYLRAHSDVRRFFQ